jgi:ssDNA-binding Zn-finger/Zn-ribbon topoisomerase 1
VYIDTATKVTIGCLRNPDHGFWEARPRDLKCGKGCPKCGRAAINAIQRGRRNRAAQSLQARLDDLFGIGGVDATGAQYVNAHTHIEVSCGRSPQHGTWSVKPNNLLNGFGCPKCGNEAAAEKLSRNARQNLISDITQLHGSALELVDPSQYRNSQTPIGVRCLQDPEHNVWQAYPLHLKCGVGCPKCAEERRLIAVRRIAELAAVDFPDRVIGVHGANAIGVHKAQYVNARTPVRLKCLKDDNHGEWLATPYSVLSGSGCPLCSASRGERFIANFLGQLGIEFEAQAILSDAFRFDFYIPSQKLLIEFDGEQHFTPVAFGSSARGAAMHMFAGVQR